MIVVSELIFQIGLIVLLLALITVGSMYLPKWVKLKSKKQAHLISFLLSAFALASYIQLTSFIPVAYAGDYFVTGKAIKEVSEDQARSISIPRAFVINEYEQQPINISLTSGDNELFLTVETTDYQAVADFARDHDSLITANRSIDMIRYYQERLMDTYAELANEREDEIVIKSLSEKFPEHRFTLQSS